jgi:hypothetical protein
MYMHKDYPASQSFKNNIAALSQKDYASALGLSVEQLLDFGEVRTAYKKQMLHVRRNREQRVKLNRAYSEVCARHFKSLLSDL